MGFMIYIAIGCVILAALIIIIQDIIKKRRQKSNENTESPSNRKKTFLYVFIVVAILISIWLLLSGRWQFISFIVLSIIPALNKLGLFSLLLRLFIGHQATKLFQKFTQNNTQQPTEKTNMSIEQALDILGLEANPSHDDIISAHRRLIAKIHPDQGGSEALARDVNLARDILLQHYKYNG